MFEYTITFDREVGSIWMRKFNAVTVLFFLVSPICNMSLHGLTDVSSEPLSRYHLIRRLRILYVALTFRRFSMKLTFSSLVLERQLRCECKIAKCIVAET